MIDQLLSALQLRDWYAVAAIALYVALAAWKRFGPTLTELPDGWRWLPPVVLAGATGFVAAWQGGEPVGAALLAAVGAILTIAVPAMGLHSGLKEAGKGPLKKLGAKLPSVLLFCGGLAAGVGSSACSAGAKPILRTVADIAHIMCVNFFSEKPGIDPERAAREFCATEQQIRPFIEQVLRSKDELRRDGVGQEPASE